MINHLEVAELFDHTFVMRLSAMPDVAKADEAHVGGTGGRS